MNNKLESNEVIRCIIKKDGYIEKIIIDRNKDIKKQVYELMKRDDYNPTLGNILNLFGIDDEDMRQESREKYLRKLYFSLVYRRAYELCDISTILYSLARVFPSNSEGGHFCIL